MGIINKDNHFIYILRTNLNFSVAMADHADGEGLPPLVVRKICHKNENNYLWEFFVILFEIAIK